MSVVSDMVTRAGNAHEGMVSSIVEQFGFSAEEAEKILQVLKKANFRSASAGTPSSMGPSGKSPSCGERSRSIRNSENSTSEPLTENPITV